MNNNILNVYKHFIFAGASDPVREKNLAHGIKRMAAPGLAKIDFLIEIQIITNDNICGI